MKDEILDDLLAKENPGTPTYATFSDRIFASVLDTIVLLPLIFLSIYNMLNWQIMTLSFLTLLLNSAYKPILEWKRGGTLGKDWMGIKIVDEELKPIELSHALIRYLPWAVSVFFSMIGIYYFYSSPDLATNLSFMELARMQENPLSNIQSLYSILFLVIIVTLVWDKKNQGLHDKWAKTLVVKK